MRSLFAIALIVAAAASLSGCPRGGDQTELGEADQAAAGLDEPAYIEEVEPNDEPEQAQSVAASEWMRGGLPADDVDWLRWPSAQGSSTLELVVSEPVKLSVFDAELQLSQEFSLEPSDEPQRLGPFSRQSMRWLRLEGPAEEWRLREIAADVADGCLSSVSDFRAHDWPIGWRACVAQGERQGLVLPFALIAEYQVLGLEMGLESGERAVLSLLDAEGESRGTWLVDSDGWRLPALLRPDIPGDLTLIVEAQGADVSFRLSVRDVAQEQEGELVELEPNDTFDQPFRVFVPKDIVGSFYVNDDVDHVLISPQSPVFGRYLIELGSDADTVEVHALNADAEVAGRLNATGTARAALGCPRVIDREQPLRLRLFPQAPAFARGYRLIWQPLELAAQLATVRQWPLLEVDASELGARVAAAAVDDAARAAAEGEDGGVPEPAPPRIYSLTEAPLSGSVYLAKAASEILAFSVVGEDSLEASGDAAAVLGEGRLHIEVAPEMAARVALRLLDDDGALVSQRRASEEGGRLTWAVELPEGLYALELSVDETPRAPCGSVAAVQLRWEELEREAAQDDAPDELDGGLDGHPRQPDSGAELPTGDGAQPPHETPRRQIRPIPSDDGGF